MLENKRKRLGDILVDVGKITVEQLHFALDLQKKRGDKIGKILIDEGMISEDEIMEVLEFQLGIPHANLDKYYVNPEVAKTIPESLARKYNAVPIRKISNVLTVAMSDPMNIFAIDEIKLVSGLDVQPAIASEDDIKVAIEFYYGKQTAQKAVDDFNKENFVEVDNSIEKELLNQVNNAPVVRLVNSLIEQAAVSRASDIHIEPSHDKLRIRFRVDGQMQEIMNTSMHTHSAIVARIKIMANLNIAERRLPQDGRLETNVGGKNLDLRISILPTVFGEKVVIRILDSTSYLLNIQQLGFARDNLSKFERLLKSPNGIILVTGPTGSGKSTTLYSALKKLNDSTVNIITLEDPVEYKMEGINQVQVNPKAGLTFANGLKAILRQDPNIIMVGEIRDDETVSLAVKAAITGHLVLSTLHTNDAASSIVRLVDMGVEPYLVASSITGVVSQRLIRKICPDCKVAYKATAEELKALKLDPQAEINLYKGEGCSSCKGLGYKGRTAVHEIMLVNNKIRDLISQKVSSDKLFDLAVGQGMSTLKDNCIELVLNGVTSIREMMKIVYIKEDLR